MAIFSSGVTIAPVIGPVLGGWLTTNYCWNYVFFISIPFCIASFIMIARFVEDPPYIQNSEAHKFDVLGFILLIIWISSFQVMVDNGQKNGWFDSAYICKLGAVSLISFITLLWWELTNKEPLFDLKIFKNWNFTFGTAIVTMIFAIAYGSIAILPQLLQSLMGYTSFLSGIAVMPMGVGSVIGTILTTIAYKIDLRHQVVAGILIFSFGCYMFSNLNLAIAMGNVILPNIILGIGMITVIIPITTIIYSYVAKHEMTNASALQNLVKNVGCAIGTSSVGVLVSRFSQIHQSYLVNRMTLLNTVFSERVSAMSASFIQVGMDSYSAQQIALGKIYHQLMQQTMICAYMSLFRVYAVAVILVLPLAFVLKKCK